MAIVIRGKSICSLCGEVMEDGQELVSFSPFIANEMDPLFPFSDGAFHVECFHQHPLSTEASVRYKESLQNTGPGNRICVVCKTQITDPDDYFGAGYLVNDTLHPLYRYNYTHAHLSCLPRWPDLSHVYTLIQELEQSAQWKGRGLDRILSALKRAGVD